MFSILRMNEAGLLEKWRRRFQLAGNRCVGNDGAERDGKANKKRDQQRIALNNMSGSFVVILVGMFSSVVVFIIELILRRRRENTFVAVHPQSSSVDPIKEADEASPNSNHQPNVNINKPSVNLLNNDQIQSPVVHYQSDIVVDNRLTTTDDASHVVSVARIRPGDGINETDNESSDYVLNMIDRPVVKGEADESQVVIINSLPSTDLNEKETAVIASIETEIRNEKTTVVIIQNESSSDNLVSPPVTSINS